MDRLEGGLVGWMDGLKLTFECSTCPVSSFFVELIVRVLMRGAVWTFGHLSGGTPSIAAQTCNVMAESLTCFLQNTPS